MVINDFIKFPAVQELGIDFIIIAVDFDVLNELTRELITIIEDMLIYDIKFRKDFINHSNNYLSSID